MKVGDIVYTFDEKHVAIAKIEVVGLVIRDYDDLSMEEWDKLPEDVKFPNEVEDIKNVQYIEGKVLKTSKAVGDLRKGEGVTLELPDEVYFTLEDVKKVMMGKYEKNLDKAIKKLSK